jgi:Fe2+ or Zn2+ uptake regulation protein
LPWKPPVDPVFSPEDLQGFRVDHQSLNLWGLCPKCQAKTAPKVK